MARLAFLTVATLAGLSGCASIVEGRQQEIKLNTNPPDADCVLMRQGIQIGEVSHTPGSTVVEKSNKPIDVVCRKPGYQDAKQLDKSDIAAATAGNLLAGGLIGIAIDLSTGAGVKYDGTLNLTLPPAAPPPDTTAKPTAPQAPQSAPAQTAGS